MVIKRVLWVSRKDTADVEEIQWKLQRGYSWWYISTSSGRNLNQEQMDLIQERLVIAMYNYSQWDQQFHAIHDENLYWKCIINNLPENI